MTIGREKCENWSDNWARILEIKSFENYLFLTSGFIGKIVCKKSRVVVREKNNSRKRREKKEHYCILSNVENTIPVFKNSKNPDFRDVSTRCSDLGPIPKEVLPIKDVHLLHHFTHQTKL